MSRAIGIERASGIDSGSANYYCFITVIAVITREGFIVLFLERNLYFLSTMADNKPPIPFQEAALKRRYGYCMRTGEKVKSVTCYLNWTKYVLGIICTRAFLNDWLQLGLDKFNGLSSPPGRSFYEGLWTILFRAHSKDAALWGFVDVILPFMKRVHSNDIALFRSNCGFALCRAWNTRTSRDIDFLKQWTLAIIQSVAPTMPNPSTALAALGGPVRALQFFLEQAKAADGRNELEWYAGTSPLHSLGANFAIGKVANQDEKNLVRFILTETPKDVFVAANATGNVALLS